MKKAAIILGAIFIFANESKASTYTLSIKNRTEIPTYLESPLHRAICKGDIEKVKKCIEYGADVNKMARKMTPLMLAARYNHVEIIKILLANGARSSIINEQGFKALDYANYAKAAESIAILEKLR
ncbi:ankyrin repeat domain-containing protein [Flavobacterium tistrianum]|uniref:ankyrin repeat domain-containing protein n=1 Tax=Flavobacterium tistrianum TaxID=1685414 RepID=UPI000DAB68CF|nr:ankyrin repeat domain-containing protein [Flavobacterium tistrianum]KAF2341955.1 ankyrin repeat domain-containing protein [Flavobacterium tistrianum]